MRSFDLHVTKGGQISIPAEIRSRWGTETLRATDTGESLVIAPVESLEAALKRFRSTFKLPKDFDFQESLRRFDREEAEAEARKWKRHR